MRTVTTDLGVAACLVENNKIIVKRGQRATKISLGASKGTVDEGEIAANCCH